MTDKQIIAFLWRLLIELLDGNHPSGKQLVALYTEFVNRGFMEEGEDLLEVDLSDGPGYVYVIYVGKGICKIGETKVLDTRLKQIDGKEVVKIIKTNFRLALEKQLHVRYDGVRLTPSQELFALTHMQIQEVYQIEDEVDLDLPYDNSLI